MEKILLDLSTVQRKPFCFDKKNSLFFTEWLKKLTASHFVMSFLKEKLRSINTWPYNRLVEHNERCIMWPLKTLQLVGRTHRTIHHVTPHDITTGWWYRADHTSCDPTTGWWYRADHGYHVIPLDTTTGWWYRSDSTSCGTGLTIHHVWPTWHNNRLVVQSWPYIMYTPHDPTTG